MANMQRTRARKYIAWGAGLFVLLIFWLSAAVVWDVVGKYRALSNNAKTTIGKPEAEVYAVMGQPKHVIDKVGARGETLNEPWKSMNFRAYPERTNTNKVLLYMKGWTAVYIFVGEDGRVEAIETAGT